MQLTLIKKVDFILRGGGGYKQLTICTLQVY